MQLPGKDLQQLLEKYHEGTLTPEQLRQLHLWYEQLDVADGEQLQSAEYEQHTRDEIYAGIVNKMAGALPVPDQQKKAPIQRLFIDTGWKKISRIAAVLLVSSGVIWLAQTTWRKQPVTVQSEPAKNNSPLLKEETAQKKELIVRSGRTERKKITLPDGSVAWLNARSVLKYPDHFTGSNRVVRVERGEVFFNIERDTSHPFTVYTGSVATTVLGTSFVVKQTFENNAIEVSVRTGKVKVEKFSSSGASLQVGRLLLPGDQLTFDTSANTYQLKQVSVKGIAAFIEGKLLYDDASLEEIVFDINRKYNINITFENKRLKQCHYQIALDDMPLNDCLQLLGTLSNTRIEKLDKTHYLIKGESCN